MPTPSNRYRNWTAVLFATVALDGIKSVNLDLGMQTLAEGADADQGPTHTAVIFSHPTFTVTSINAAAWLTSLAGVFGVFTATLNDSKNGAVTGGGGKIFTTNALSYIATHSLGGEFNALNTKNVAIHTTFADGVTNPVSVAAA